MDITLNDEHIAGLKKLTASMLASGKRIMFSTPDTSAYLSARIDHGKLRLSCATMDSPGSYKGDANALLNLELWLKDLGLGEKLDDCEQRSQSYRCMVDIECVESLLEKTPWDAVVTGNLTWPLPSHLTVLTSAVDE